MWVLFQQRYSMVWELLWVEKVTTYEFVTDNTRKAVSYTKVASYLENGCESKAMYEVDTIYSLRFLQLFGDTTLYNRTLSSNNLILSTDKAISALGCTGVTAGATLNLMSEEEWNVFSLSDM